MNIEGKRYYMCHSTIYMVAILDNTVSLMTPSYHHMLVMLCYNVLLYA